MAETKRHAGVDYKGEHDEYRPLAYKGTAKQKAESDAIIAKYANRKSNGSGKKTTSKKTTKKSTKGKK